MFDILKNKNVIIGLVIVLWLWFYFIFWGSKWNSWDFILWDGVTIGSLDNSSDNSTSIETVVKNLQEQNQEILNNITNLTDEEKQNQILEKTLQNNSEIDTLKQLYFTATEESDTFKEKQEAFTEDELKK